MEKDHAVVTAPHSSIINNNKMHINISRDNERKDKGTHHALFKFPPHITPNQREPTQSKYICFNYKLLSNIAHRRYPEIQKILHKL